MRTKTTDYQMSEIGKSLEELRTIEGPHDSFGVSFYDVVPQLFLQDGGWTFVQAWPGGGYRVIFHGTLPQVRAKIAEMILDAKTHKYREACRMSLEWIENLIRRYGEEEVLDQLPNNTGGRTWLREAINLE